MGTKKSGCESNPGVKVPDLDFSRLAGPHPPSPRLTMDQYHDWVMEMMAMETPEQRERRLNRPLPCPERFVLKN